METAYSRRSFIGGALYLPLGGALILSACGGGQDLLGGEMPSSPLANNDSQNLASMTEEESARMLDNHLEILPEDLLMAEKEAS